MTYSREDDLALLQSLAADISPLALTWFRQTYSLKNKESHGFDPVTEADEALEAHIRERLLSERPNDGILGEEGERVQGASGRTWIVDPIDGTRAFLAGLPTWCSLICLVENDEPVLSAIVQPVTGEVFTGASHGDQSFARLSLKDLTSDLTVSSCDRVEHSILTTTDPYLFEGAEHTVFQTLKDTSRLTRYGLDAYGYAALATGSLDLVVESGLQPWDIAALIPVVRGAGGVITNWSGGNPMQTGQLVAAATPALHAEALKYLNPAAL